jgi:hypothetical protein
VTQSPTENFGFNFITQLEQMATPPLDALLDERDDDEAGLMANPS